MTLMVSVMMYGWIPFVILLFYLLPPRKAVFVSVIFGYLFLPQAAIRLPGLPDYTKAFACIYGAFLGALIFDSQRLFSFRPKWIDLPMLGFCIVPGVSSLVNAAYDETFTQGGWYDASSAAVAATLTWGLPYYLGRVYLNSLDALKEFTMLVFVGALAYVPLCLIEVRLSPQLHRWIYGYHTNNMQHNIRFGGFRPVVFMQSGLALGLYMVCAVLGGWWLYITRAQRKLATYDLFWSLAAVFATTILVKAVGAILLLFGALGALYVARWMRTALPILAIILVAPTYSLVRATGWWDGQQAVDVAAVLINEGRARSLDFRLGNEDILIAKAMEHPYFGWGRWGRSRVLDKYGKDISVTDGLWVIALGESGIVGLTCLTLAFALPPLVLLKRFGYRMVEVPALAPAVVWLVMCGLYAIDNQLNAMHNPVFLLGLGGTAALCTLNLRLAPAGRKAAQQPATARTSGQQPAPRPMPTPAPAPLPGTGRPAVLRTNPPL